MRRYENYKLKIHLSDEQRDEINKAIADKANVKIQL